MSAWVPCLCAVLFCLPEVMDQRSCAWYSTCGCLPWAVGRQYWALGGVERAPVSGWEDNFQFASAIPHSLTLVKSRITVSTSYSPIKWRLKSPTSLDQIRSIGWWVLAASRGVEASARICWMLNVPTGLLSQFPQVSTAKAKGVKEVMGFLRNIPTDFKTLFSFPIFKIYVEALYRNVKSNDNSCSKCCKKQRKGFNQK